MLPLQNQIKAARGSFFWSVYFVYSVYIILSVLYISCCIYGIWRTCHNVIMP